MNPPRFLTNIAESVFRQDKKTMDILFRVAAGAAAVSAFVILPWGLWESHKLKQQSVHNQTSPTLMQTPQPNR